MSRRFGYLISLAVVALAGCRSDGERPTSTVSPPRSNFPRGTVIPPLGFGVDLVRRGDGDASARPASFSAQSPETLQSDQIERR